MALEIVTFNVLSPDMCSSKVFPEAEPDALDPEKRWVRIVARVNRWIDAGRVVLLQELNALWVNRLSIAVAGRATVLSVGATVSWPDALFVATVVPLKFKCDDVRFFAARDILAAAPPSLRGEVAVYTRSVWRRGWPRVSRLLRTLFMAPTLAFSTACEDLARAARTPGRGLLVRLSAPDMERPVYVFNHHLPCRFEPREEDVSPFAYFHVTGALKFLQEVCGDAPVVWGGDFNCTAPNMERIVGGIPMRLVVERRCASFADRATTNGTVTLHSPETSYFCRVVDRSVGEVREFRSAIDHFITSGGVASLGPARVEVADSSRLGPNADNPSDHFPVVLSLTTGVARDE